MNLKDFVEEALIEIVEGVKAAQEKTASTGAIISPRLANFGKDKTQIRDKYCSVQIVEFEAVLAEEKGSEGTGKLGVILADWGISVKAKKEEKTSGQTSVKFTVPVILPSIDNAEVAEKRKVATAKSPH